MSEHDIRPLRRNLSALVEVLRECETEEIQRVLVEATWRHWEPGRFAVGTRVTRDPKSWPDAAHHWTDAVRRFIGRVGTVISSGPDLLVEWDNGAGRSLLPWRCFMLAPSEVPATDGGAS